jgi:membrane-associated protease RseP (regulator of RpoE activity)
MRRVSKLHLILFVVTFFSMVIAGVLQEHSGLFDQPSQLLRLVRQPGVLLDGVPFAVTLMLILLSHEFSHFFASHAHHTKATLPYFIPAPSIFGTLGAFIKMKSPIVTRKALIDIGASGPVVGFVFSVVASVIGLTQSEYVRADSLNNASDFVFGPSLLYYWLSRVLLGMPPGGETYFIDLHPMASAGWIGLFVTSLNLIPIGQLDGGHIAYALFGTFHRRLSIALVAILAIAGFLLWPGWLLWACLMVILGIKHPPVLFWETPLDPRRKMLGWSALVILILTFTPVPLALTL